MRPLTFFAAALALTAGAAFAQNKGGGGGIPSPLKITVSGYSDGGDIPDKYTCAAKPPGGSPQIDWSGAPAGTMSFALIFHDGDVHPGKTFSDVTHWIAWNIPATSTGLPAGVAAGALPDGTQQGANIARGNAYMGPCPPAGLPHHYTLEVYALDSKLDLPATAGRTDLEKALSGHILASGVYNGLFHR
ncbi:MAG TPA: YbhB/YbcL family Raf kinase inhibitor-like protein [Bryobacteraceae bacterium]|jgi:Raf kinase inhibitor-like YbhB/YbcL family protein|nr:YbhB/YbcL family Raf kinase inhibitor-like protein [Bryobacteraceae bacterium]